MRKTLVAFDNDGVFNHFSKSAKNTKRATVGEWTISWREDVLDRVRALLSRDDVTAGWLSTWIGEPKLLDELEKVYELDGVMEFRAPYYLKADGSVRNDFADRGGDTARKADWWKLRSWDLLLDEHSPHRAGWVDDELNMPHGKDTERFRTTNTNRLFLYRTDPVAGLLHSDVDKLERWLD